jgi:hypothetical protein
MSKIPALESQLKLSKESLNVSIAVKTRVPPTKLVTAWGYRWLRKSPSYTAAISRFKANLIEVLDSRSISL